MTKITYNVPLVLVAQDNKTEVAKTSIIVKDCSVFGGAFDNCDGYNFNRCPNDGAYCQPFVSGDLIYKQFKYDRRNYGSVSVKFINSETGLDFYNASSVTLQTGYDPLNNYYLNVVVDTANAIFTGVNCWYAKVAFNPKEGSESEAYSISTEPYCLVKCEQKTMLVQGYYPDGYDCNGHYYGLPLLASQSASIYRPSVRVRGTIEPNGFTFEKTINNDIAVKSKQTENYLFRTEKTPYYTVQQLSECFNSQTLTIDGVEYTGAIGLNKNFDEGSQWIISENLTKVCSEINFTCN